MATHPPTNLASRFLDVVFGKKLEGEEAALARGEGLPQWVRQGRHVLIWSTVLGFIATFLWSRGWLPFVDTRIDSIWPVAAVGLSAVIQSGWSWIVRRHERKTRTGQAVKTLSLP
ncbi:MAG: hypothetical protein IR159_01355 [Brevundimonas sp.]|nr:hypothetical protein [Brevundimonas sp.]